MNLLELGDIYLQVLVPLKLLLHWHNILCVSDLTLVRFLEVLLELIKLTSQNLTFVLDLVELPSHIDSIAESILLYNCFSLRRV